MRKLNQIDRRCAGPWIPSSYVPVGDTPRSRLPWWHSYRAELYSHNDQFTGIIDEYGNLHTFPAAFRKRRRDDEPMGIVKVAAED